MPDAGERSAARRSSYGEQCLHCGVVASLGDDFCCYGCELAHQLTGSDDDARQRTAAALTVALLLSMIVMMLSLFLYAEDVYEPAREPIYVWFRRASSWGAAVLASIVVALLGPPLARRAGRAVVQGRLTMELLILTAVAAAWSVSMVNVLGGSTTIYFDSATAALVLVTFGRYIEARARARAGGVVGPLIEPAAAPLRAGFDGALQMLAPANIVPGMNVEVPVDGVVAVDLRATSPAEVSLAVVHGESDPVVVRVGDTVPAGAVVLCEVLQGTALRDAASSTLAELERLTRMLRERRGPVLRVADRLAAWLTPVVAVVALASLLWWTHMRDLGVGIQVALAVVLVACPCTYGVITPLITWLTLRKALEHDVCIRDAAVVDALAKVKTVAFDKTGTLTEPLEGVVVETVNEMLDVDVLVLAAALERDVPHPIARAIVARAGVAEVALGRRVIGSRGVRSTTLGGRSVVVGAPGWVAAQGIDVPSRWSDVAAVLALGGRAVGAFRIGERVRADAVVALSRLRGAGTEVAIVSGDRPARVRSAARRLGVSRFASELRPADKACAVADFDRPALVGDGINDAPAAAVAVASFAVSNAASLNRGVADVVLLSSNLELVPWTLELARRALALSRQVLIAATLYNVVFVGLAAMGWLRPVWAGVSMLVASVVALVGGLRMASHPAPGAHAVNVASERVMA